MWCRDTGRIVALESSGSTPKWFALMPVSIQMFRGGVPSWSKQPASQRAAQHDNSPGDTAAQPVMCSLPSSSTSSSSSSPSSSSSFPLPKLSDAVPPFDDAQRYFELEVLLTLGLRLSQLTGYEGNPALYSANHPPALVDAFKSAIIQKLVSAERTELPGVLTTLVGQYVSLPLPLPVDSAQHITPQQTAAVVAVSRVEDEGVGAVISVQELESENGLSAWDWHPTLLSATQAWRRGEGVPFYRV